jgi:lipoyl(octanoyl) transferase
MLIETLAEFNVKGERRQGRVGIWVQRGVREDKIAALGVRIKRWVTLQRRGVECRSGPDPFRGIVPCGIRAHGVTSLVDLGIPATVADVDVALQKSFRKIFG